MKKAISFIFAFLFGYAASAQVSKTDTTKIPVRKVLASDVKKLPASDSSPDKNAKVSSAHGAFVMKGRDNQILHKGTNNKKEAVADKPVKDN